MRKKVKKRKRKAGDKRRRSPSSRKSSRARAELFRLAQEAKRGAVAPCPPFPGRAPPALRPDCQGDLAAPSVTAAAREERPTSMHGAAGELMLDAAGATLLDDKCSGRENLEDDPLDADMGLLEQFKVMRSTSRAPVRPSACSLPFAYAAR